MLAAIAGFGLWLRVGACCAESPSYNETIQPLLKQYCVNCHGKDEQNAGVDFSKFANEREAARQRKLWRKAIAQVDAGLMPPRDADLPTEEDRKRLLQWMQHSVETIDNSDPANRDPGPLVIRRLTLAEYNNTVRDLLGFDFDASSVGMTDDADEGNLFGNLASAMDVSAGQMDKYFAASDKLVDRLFGTELSSRVDGRIREDARLTREMMFGLDPGKWRNVNTEVTPPEGITEREAARKIIASFVRRAFRRPITDVDLQQLMSLFDAATAKGQDYVGSVKLAIKASLVSPHFLFRIERAQPEKPPGDVFPVSDVELASRLSYFLWSTMPDEQLLDLAERNKLTRPGPSDEPIPFEGTVIGAAGSETFQGNNRDKVFDGKLSTFLDGPDNNSHWIGLDLGQVREFRRLRFAGRPGLESRMVGGKFQASATADFSSDVVDLLEVTQPPTRGYVNHDLEESVAYRYVRYVPPPNAYGNIAELEVWGLAAGTVLEQQINRMLADPRARALTDNFAARWLQIDQLSKARPSTEFFPEFNSDLRLAMQAETTTFFDHLRKDDRSLLELLDADYTFANDKLAGFYGIDPVEGKELQRVSLKPEHHRGGLLGMGSVLAMTSHTSRTSPTLRGKWILETILGTPPPPPPANVEQIKEQDEAGKEPTTFREKLSQHSRDAACAACHRRMDPLGFALDNYNAVGKWRNDAGGRPLDVAGVLPDGTKIEGVVALKQVIATQQSQFVRHLTEQLLSYALGRELDFYDDGPVQQITIDLKKNDYRFSTLVAGIVKSYPFQFRKNEANAE